MGSLTRELQMKEIQFRDLEQLSRLQTSTNMLVHLHKHTVNSNLMYAQNGEVFIE